MDTALIFFFAGILIFAGILFAVITLTKKGSRTLSVDKYRMKWMQLEQQLKKDETSSYHMVVLNADKLLDQALREKGVRGTTMGERMRNIKDTWTNANSVWNAHKLRNRIAHETEVNISYDDARRALSSFKQALKDVGAI